VAELTLTDWDPEYAMVAAGDLLPRLAYLAWGEEYPLELRPYGFTTRTLLERLHRHLDLRPDGTLADLACGEGGPGWWLARTGGARLLGVDWSIVGVRAAARLAGRLDPTHTVDVRYVVATLTGVGLADASVDAAVCLDALMYCEDRPAAFAEMYRVLRPGGRWAITAQEAAGRASPHPNGPGLPRYRPIAEAAGLVVDVEEGVAGWSAGVRRNFELWLEHADDLRRELGEEISSILLGEAAEVLTTLGERRQVLLLGTRP
jgi:SAM-dependent methyltransferase